jgi:hypothetical protein
VNARKEARDPASQISTATETAAATPQAGCEQQNKGRPPQGRPFFLLYPYRGISAFPLQELATSSVSG